MVTPPGMLLDGFSGLWSPPDVERPPPMSSTSGKNITMGAIQKGKAQDENSTNAMGEMLHMRPGETVEQLQKLAVGSPSRVLGLSSPGELAKLLASASMGSPQSMATPGSDQLTDANDETPAQPPSSVLDEDVPSGMNISGEDLLRTLSSGHNSASNLPASHAQARASGAEHSDVSESTSRRIALLCHGWHHDIEPFIVLANALVRRGHTVYVAAPEQYMPQFQAAHADWFIPLDHDPHSVSRGKKKAHLQQAIDGLETENLRRISESMGNPCCASNAAAIWHACAGNKAFCASLSERARGTLAASSPQAELPRVDALVFHISLGNAALTVGEFLSIPAVGVVTSSELLPSLKPVDSNSSRRPNPDPGKNENLGLEGFHESWRMQAHSQTVSDILYIRREMGLPLSLDPETGHCVCNWQAAGWLLAASVLLPPFPRLDIPGATNVLASCVVTGALQAPSSQRPRMPSKLTPAVSEEVEEFFAAGPSPVYVSFAGMVVVSTKLLKCVTAALKALSLRAIFGDFLGVDTDLLSAGGTIPVLIVHNVSSTLLLPRCSCVIHHGSPVIFHAALYAACPSVIVPVYGDQMSWAEAAAALGVGPMHPVSLQHLTTRRLIQLLSEAMSPDVVQTTKRVGARERERDLQFHEEGEAGGAHRATDAIEMLISGPPETGPRATLAPSMIM